MKFDYDYYKRELYSFPIYFLIGACIGIVPFVWLIINNLSNDTFMLFFTLISLLAVITVWILTIYGKLKYGIKLKSETPDDALSITGTIDKISTIKTPFSHMYKIAPLNVVKAQIITISGNKYYFMQKGDLRIGNYIEIKYLPKSTIVLEANIINHEDKINTTTPIIRNYFMKFDYGHYKSELFFYPIRNLIIYCVSIVLLIRLFISKIHSMEENIIIPIVLCVLLLTITILLFIDIFGRLKYGIYLKKETPNDALVTTGSIDKIETFKNPVKFKVKPNCYDIAQSISISGNKYYIMQKWELKVGDYVKISYLPKSTIVLEVTIIYQE